MSIHLKDLKYRVGVPGMIATTGYKHTRQQTQDSIWINKTANTNFPFGVAACVDPVTGNICLADTANAEFLGVFQDPARLIDQPYYAPKDPLIVCTMGDIWVKVEPNLVIKPISDPVFYIKTPGATLGYFTNVPGASNVMISTARFTTENANGVVTLSLGSWGATNT